MPTPRRFICCACACIFVFILCVQSETHTLIPFLLALPPVPHLPALTGICTSNVRGTRLAPVLHPPVSFIVNRLVKRETPIGFYVPFHLFFYIHSIQGLALHIVLIRRK